MNTKDALAWFEKLAKMKVPPGNMGHYELRGSAAWTAEAQAALEAVFPPGHAVRRRWDALMTGPASSSDTFVCLNYVMDQLRSIFETALGMLRDGRINGLIAGIQAETVGELIEQADDLVANFRVAAAVIAGGALETHLRHLCERHTLTIEGSGSLENYNTALARARKAGAEILGTADNKLIVGWSDMRNKAAHDPSNFPHDAAAVRLMIEGIRQLVARVP